MADEIKTEVTQPELYEPEAEIPAPREEVPDEPEAAVEEVAEEKPVETPPEKHTTAAIEQASRLGIPADEIDDMTPKELTRTIAQLNRYGQAVWDHAQKQPAVPKVQDTPKEEEDVLFPKEMEDALAPEYVAPVKKKFAEFAKSLKAKDAEIKEIKEQLQADRVERVHSRIDTLLAKLPDEVSSAFDRTTAKGQENFVELMQDMLHEQAKGKTRNKEFGEEMILHRTLRAMGYDIPTKKASAKEDDKDAQLKEREEEFKEGSLGQPNSRNGKRDLSEVIQNMARKKGMLRKQPEEPTVEWLEPKTN